VKPQACRWVPQSVNPLQLLWAPLLGQPWVRLQWALMQGLQTALPMWSPKWALCWVHQWALSQVQRLAGVWVQLPTR